MGNGGYLARFPTGKSLASNAVRPSEDALASGLPLVPVVIRHRLALISAVPGGRHVSRPERPLKFEQPQLQFLGRDQELSASQPASWPVALSTGDAPILSPRNFVFDPPLYFRHQRMEVHMGFGRGALLWLIGIPLPIIILLALFMHH
jgi:hypothetical protein